MMQKGAFYETAERLCDKTSACQRPGSSGHGALAVRHGRPGLFLERQANFSTQSFRFRRGTPRNGRRYRLCPAKYGDTAPSEELLELYADQGWQYVVCAGRGTICVHVFFHDDPAAPEPFTDTDSLIYALRTPIRRGFATLLFSGYLLFHAITRLSWGLDRGPIYRLEAIGFYVPICICFFLLLMDRGVNLAALLLFRRRLRQEKQPPLPYSATLFRAQTVLEAFIVPLFLFILFSFGFSTLSSRSDLPLTNWDPDFPLLCNDVDIDRSLVRTRYFIDQSGSGARGRASMEIHYFIDPTARSAQSLLEGLEQAALTGDGYYSQLPASLPFQEAAVPGAEAFRFRRDGIHWEILAQKDRRALLLSYEGSRDLSQWFPQIVQLLTQTSEP